MAVNTTLAGLSQTAASNGPDGATDAPATLDDAIRNALAFTATLRDGKGLSAEADVASAATTDIGAANSSFVRVTGTTAITSFGANYNGPRFVRFAAALTLTHNATTLILPGAANIVTAAGDTCIAIPLAAGWYVLGYQRAAGVPLNVGPAFSAYGSASQSITASTDTKVTLDVELFDTNANFATSRFTPTLAGYYQINGVIRCSATGATTYYAAIYKNGAAYAKGSQSIIVANSLFQHVGVSEVVYLNGTTDYVELFGFIDGTSAGFNFASSASTSRFSGAYLRGG